MNNQVYPVDSLITREMRESIKGQKACTIWLYGLSGSGKTTIANKLDVLLFEAGYHSYILDGDSVRTGLNNNLGFTEEDRDENIRRCAEVCKLMNDAGIIVISCFITPLEKNRQKIRDVLGESLIEVFIDADLSVCINRDPKGLYRKALDGTIQNFTGVSAPFESSVFGMVLKNNEIEDIENNAKTLLSKINSMYDEPTKRQN